MVSLFFSLWILVSIVIVAIAHFILELDDQAPYPLQKLMKFGKLCYRKKESNKPVNTSYDKLIELLQIPKRWFSHFYLLGFFCHFSALFIWQICYDNQCPKFQGILGFIFDPIGGSNIRDLRNVNAHLIYFLYAVQLLRRIIEHTFLLVPSLSKMNLLHYAIGLSFYVSSTLLILYYLLVSPDITQTQQNISLSSKIAVVLFMLGQILQFHTHKTLASFRANMRDKELMDPKKAYSMPTGGGFNWVSCPNYLAELIIYTALLVLAHFEVNMLAITIFVYGNQVMSALHSHFWYRSTFGSSYPSNRKAIIPFLL